MKATRRNKIIKSKTPVARKSKESNKINYYIFWCNCGQSENKKILGFVKSRYPNEESIKEELLSWCERNFSFWNTSEKLITYGFEPVKIPSRKSLLKRWGPLCKKRKEINNEYEMIYQMLLHAK